MKVSFVFLALAASSYANHHMDHSPNQPHQQGKGVISGDGSNGLYPTQNTNFRESDQWRQLQPEVPNMPWCYKRTRILRRGFRPPNTAYHYLLSSFIGDVLVPKSGYWLLYNEVKDNISPFRHWSQIYYPSIHPLSEFVGKFMNTHPNYNVYIRKWTIILDEDHIRDPMTLYKQIKALDSIRPMPGT